MTAKRRATELGVGDPQEGEFWYSLGYTCWMSGRNAEAIPAFERAVALNPPGSLFHEQARQGIDFCRSNLGLDRPGGEW